MGSKGYETGAHVVFKLSVHLVFVTKYRRKAITARVADVLVQAFRESCAVYGGESGQRARECDVAAVRRVVTQCRDKRVPVFVKQLGRTPMIEGKRLRLYVEGGKPDAKGKSIGQWPRDLQVREFPS